MTKRMRLITIMTAGVLSVSITAALLLQGQQTAYAEYNVDFEQGTYDLWDGETYTFDWYETPVDIDGVLTYTITTASDLAGLSIVTNDISGTEYADIAAKVPSQYVALADTFEGKAIVLAGDIDLAGFDWLPIAYPWKTANLTSKYDITTPDGTVVHYNAVDDIPDDTVDPWVGDENGDPISTRYWEFPESELRFRDYAERSTHTLYDVTLGTTDGVGYFFRYYDPNTFKGSRSIKNSKGEYTGTYTLTAYDIMDKTVTVPAVHMQDIVYATDVNTLYGIKNIKGYTETEGFQGTLNGAGHRIKGVTPRTPWTDDVTERLNTYDPLAKGFVGMLGEKGTITDLNLKGEYTDEVVSYGALLCAYNYGVIANCFINGQMQQSLITMTYPIRREYASTGSTYEYAANPGPVMSLGNSGFVTSQNYGTIKNCYTTGEVKQAYRAFGFFAATNYGVIENCENRATLNSAEVYTAFTTDEWQWDTDIANRRTWLTGMTTTAAVSKGTDWSFYGAINRSHGNDTWSFAGTFDPVKSSDNYPFGSNTYKPMAKLPKITNYDMARLTTLTEDACADNFVYSAYIRSTMLSSGRADMYKAEGTTDPYAPDLWLPALYKTDDGESIAANHLYGVYIQTAAGGIAAVNRGEIRSSINKGNISGLYGVSPRENYKRYNGLDADIAEPQDYYNYIRPNNQYGIFSTAGSTVTLAGGIAGLNTGTISDCENAGVITERQFVTEEAHTNRGETYDTIDEDTEYTDFILVTRNGFYQNGTYLTDSAGQRYLTTTSNAWWMTEDYYDNQIAANGGVIPVKAYLGADTDKTVELGMSFVYTEFDRNMPYPYYQYNSVYAFNYAAGIAAQNSGALINVKHTGTAGAAIVTVSHGADKAAELTCCRAEGNVTRSALAYTIVDTNVTDCEVNYTHTRDSKTATVACLLQQVQYPMEVHDVYSYMVGSAFYKVVANDVLYLDNIQLYGSHASLVQSIMQNTNVNNLVILHGITSAVARRVVAGSLSNIYVYGASSLWNEATLRNASDGIYMFAANMRDVLGDVSNAENGSLNNVYLYAFDDTSANGLGTCNGASSLATVVGTFKDIALNNMNAFVNSTDTKVFSFKNCDITGLSYVGEIQLSKDNSDYLYYFEDCTGEDILLQGDITVTGNNVFVLPGLLKGVYDTNTFTRCVVAALDGMQSFSVPVAILPPDNTIKTDAALVYEQHAGASGALAYAADHGATDTRTYDYTVATGDTIDIYADVEDLIEMDKVAGVQRTYALPAYTRKVNSGADKAYYAVSAPFNGAGAGYLQLSSNGYKTTDDNAAYLKDTLYVRQGDAVALDTIVTEGHELYGIERNGESIALQGANPVYTMTMPDHDVEFLGKWANVYTITPDTPDWCTITTSATGAIPGTEVSVQVAVTDTAFDIARLYYCPYVKDSNNLWKLDVTKQTDLILDTSAAANRYVFDMPEANVCIFAEKNSTANSIKSFVLAGQQGIIDDVMNTISVTLDASVDLTNIAPDSIITSADSTIAPSADIAQDFTKAVVYTVTAANGDERRYTVTVTAKKDGEITRFKLLQYEGTIAADDKINVTVPESVDITNCVPEITWSGLSITPTTDMSQDFTHDMEYTVVSSTGDIRKYTVHIACIETDAPVGSVEFTTVTGLQLQTIIDYDLRRITVLYPYDTDVSTLQVTGLSFAGTTNIVAGDTLNLTKYNCLIVTDNGVSTAFDIVGRELPYTAKCITQFRLFGRNGMIDEDTKTITITLPSKYDITDIAPDAVGYIGASITSVGEKHDFTKPVTYTVTDANGDAVEYTVIVTRG